jgi:NitT/TauT family transport system permease protein
VTAELLLIAADIGRYILNAQATLEMPSLLAGILWTLLLGYAMYAAATKIEERLLRWRTAGLGAM